MVNEKNKGNRTGRKMKFDFLTSTYEFAHGKSPRGYGSWAFKIAGQSDSEGQFFSGTFSAAKKLAKAHYLLESKRDQRPVPAHFILDIVVMS